jgi:hypothetical protein
MGTRRRNRIGGDGRYRAMPVLFACLFIVAPLCFAAESLHTSSPAQSLPEHREQKIHQQARPLSGMAGETPAPAACPPFRIASPRVLPAARHGRFYTFRLQTSGATLPLWFKLGKAARLPEGLDLITDGQIQGTPVESGTFRFRIHAGDSCPSGSRTAQRLFLLRVHVPASPVEDSPATSAGQVMQHPSQNNRASQAGEMQRGRAVSTRPAGKVHDTLPAGRTPAVSARPVDTREIVVAVAEGRSRQVRVRLAQHFPLQLVDQFSLRSLALRVLVFRTPSSVIDLEESLAAEPGVVAAYRSRQYTTLTDPKSDLQRMSRDLNFESLHVHSRGRGVRVAIVDTGVDTHHRDLDGQVSATANLVSGSAYRGEIHGTAVAGIIAAAANGFGIVGIAPEARLLALRACEQVRRDHPTGRGDTLSMIRALDEAMEQKAKIVNMSFGTAEPDPLMAMLLSRGRSRGMLFVAPVGNPGHDGKALFPASSRDVIAVAGLDADGNPYPDERSAARALAAAPAENILATIPGDAHTFITGTSMSAAIISGILAVVVEKNPGLRKSDLPPFEGDLCHWMEALLGAGVCSP